MIYILERGLSMKYIGNGIYTYKEASQLTNLSTGALRRWVEGYKHSNSNSKVTPMLNSDYQKIESKQVISFLDLIEIIFIKAFHDYGISLQSIRFAVKRASKLLNSDHPFAMKKFYTDGKTIMAIITKDAKSQDLIDLIKKQYQIVDFILPGLYECIDFDNFDFAEKWWPKGKKSGIVVDPGRNFGHPIIDEVNISTSLIQELYDSGHSVDDIMEWYDIEPKYINMALNFQKRNIA